MEEMLDAAVMRARVMVAALVGGVLTLLFVATFFSLNTPVAFLVFPVGLIGLVSPVIGYRLYLYARSKVPGGADVEGRAGAFVRATLTAMAISEGIAFCGIVVYMLTGGALALTGALTHLLLAGAIWPTREKLDQFLDSSGATG